MVLDAFSNFEKNNYILKTTLDASMMRWNTLSNNIANANTPGFKRSDVTFASQMKAALDSEKEHLSDIPNTRTDSRHFDFHPVIDYKSIRPKVQTEFYTSTNNNNNNVDMAYETGESLKTSLLYGAASSLLQRNYNLVQDMLR